VHLFWLSHEEKQPWLELSMGGVHGQSWRSMGSSPERKGMGERGRSWGARAWGGGGAPY
jgi:hypothetical protein